MTAQKANPKKSERTLLSLPPLTLRICEPGLDIDTLRGAGPRRYLVRWELTDDAGELVAAHPWYVKEPNAKAAKLVTLRHALKCLSTFRMTCPHINVLFPQSDPHTHDRAFTMLRRRPKPHWQRSFETYLAV